MAHGEERVIQLKAFLCFTTEMSSGESTLETAVVKMDTDNVYKAEEFVVLKATWFGDELYLMRDDVKVLIAEGPL